MRLRTKAEDKRRRAVVKDRQSGQTFTAIAEKYGISRQRAHQLYTEETWTADAAQAARQKKNWARNWARFDDRVQRIDPRERKP